jgi:hypothetical protein
MKKLFLLLFCFIFVVNSNSQEIKTEDDLKIYLDEKEKQFEDISIQMGIATWNIYSGEATPDTKTPRLRYLELFKNAELNNVITEWNKKINTVKDTILKRRIEVWNNILLGAKIDFDENIYPLEDKLEKWIAGDKSEGDIPDEDEINALILELMKRRNAKAIEYGYKNYAELIFLLSDIDINYFQNIVKQVDELTKKPYINFLETIKKEENKEEITGQDIRRLIGTAYRNKYSALIKNETLDSLINETFLNIGINYHSLPIRFVEKDIPFGGNGLAIKIPTDFRIVVKTQQPINVYLHELGHGLQGVSTKIEDPILKGYEWCLGNTCPAFYEGMAETMAKITNNKYWRKKFLGLTDTEIAKKDSAFNKYSSVYLRYHLYAITLEIELYKTLDKDPNLVRDSLYNYYLFAKNAFSNKFKYSEFATYISYPVYLHNYFLADIISYQIHNTLKKRFGDNYVLNKEVGKFIKEKLLEQGELVRWKDKVIKTTGKDLDIKEFLQHYGL